MKPRPRHIPSAFKHIIACTLNVCLLSASMLSFGETPPSGTLSPHQGTPVPSLPPTVTDPSASSQPVDAVDSPPSDSLRTSQTPPKPTTPPINRSAASTRRINPMTLLMQKQIFPADAPLRVSAINRAEWADILVKTLGHNTQLVSEFPFYKDINQSYWAYAPIEVAREKRLIEYPNDHGYYHPEQQVTYGDVYQALSHAITGPPPTTDTISVLLQGFTDRDEVPETLAPAIAKMVRVRFFTAQAQNTEPGVKQTLHVNENVTYQGLAPFLAYLVRLVERRGQVRAFEGTQNHPILPPSLHLILTPGTSISESKLQLGSPALFTLMEAVPPLTKGSYLRGIVRETLPDHTYLLEFSQARTPEGAYYETLATLQLTFSPKNKLDFIVPGEKFEVITQPVASADEIPTNAASENPPPQAPIPQIQPVQPVDAQATPKPQ